MKKLVILIFCLSAGAISHAQIGTLCNNAAPICAQTGLSYTNSTGVPSLGTINCLGSSPNPSFFFMQVDNAGTINMSLGQTNSSGTNTDVDFQLWGPFPSVAAGCASISNNVANSNADCSYAGGGTIEQVNIVNGQPGDFYILLNTNFSNTPGTITLTLNSNSTGSTNCGILSNAQNNGPICEDEVLLLTGDDGGTGGPYTYNWYLMPDFGTSLNTTTNFAFSPPAPGTYEFAFVLMDQATFEADTAYTTAVVNEIPDAPTFSSTAPACEGSTVMMYPDNAITGATYSWSGTNGFTSNQPSVTFANANPALFNATYSLTVTVNGCTSDPYSEALVIFDTNVPVVTGPTEVCEGQTIPLAVSNGNLFASFAWNNVQGSNPQEVPAGSYTVTATDANGCETTSTPAYVVDLIDNPLSISGPDHFCEGSPITLSATPGKQSYSWSTGSNAETTQVSVDGPVVVTVMSQEGCERSDTLDVSMYDKPEADFSPLMSCDSTVSFSNESSVSDAYGSVQQSWAWSFGHMNPDDSTQAVSTVADPVHTFPAPGIYNVTLVVESNFGCIDQKQVAFEVIQKPLVNFEFESLCFAEGKFLNLSEKGSYGFQSVTWDFGDGSPTESTTDSVVYYGYPTIATYEANLSITDSAGCISSLSKQIQLKDTPVFEDMPNIITPNGDNLNDDLTFLPVMEDCFNYTFAVFNRWGAKVFETSTSEKGFGGVSGLGSKLQDGVYFWVLIANGIGGGQGEQVLKQGTITVAGTK